MATGCAATGTVESPATAAAKRRVQQVTAEHADVAKRLSTVPTADRSQCEASEGDCLLQASELRGTLVSRYSLNSCDAMNQQDAKARCILGQLSEPGHRGEVTEYYAFENWCMNKILACTAGRAEQARLVALEQRFMQRRQQAELSAESIHAWNEVELARSKVDYLRLSLPPRAAGLCTPLPEREQCEARCEAEQKALDIRLRQDVYDAKRAVTDYAAAKLAEAGCERPELECLSSAVNSYGVFPEARKWVDRNLALLTQRQALSSAVSAEAQGECLADLQQAHQARIVDAYTTYSHQTVLYFRIQLDQAFISLYEAQVGCLTGQLKVAPAITGPVAKQ